MSYQKRFFRDITARQAVKYPRSWPTNRRMPHTNT